MEKKETTNFKKQSNTKKLVIALIELKQICDEHGLPFWLNFGALLGMVRENRLLPWNNDVELGCWADDAPHQKMIAVTDALALAGYNCFYYKSFGTLNIKKDIGVDININLYWRLGEHAVRPHETPSKFQDKHILASVFYWLSAYIYLYPGGVSQGFRRRNFRDTVKFTVYRVFAFTSPRIRKICFYKLLDLSEYFGGVFQQTAIPKKYFCKLSANDFYGCEMNYPTQSEELLALIYGKDWRIPKENWSWHHEDNKSTSGVVVIKNRFDYDQLDLE